MNREALMSGLLSSIRSEIGYSAERVLSRLVLRDNTARDVGVVLFGGSSHSPRCVVWQGTKLVGQCQFSGESGWKIFPIVGGLKSPVPLVRLDPIHFVIEKDSSADLPPAGV